MVDYDASSVCAELGGWPVWFTDAAEWNWFRSVMDDFSLSCYHIGEHVLIMNSVDLR